MKTLLNKVNELVMLTLFLSVTSLFAQKAETPNNNYTLGAKINDMTITEGGTVVVATNDGGYAILGFTQSNDNDITDKQDESFDYWLLKFSPENEQVLRDVNNLFL